MSEYSKQSVRLLTLCTGNAARSVMAGAMLARLADSEGIGLHVTTAGTHTLDGQPMSMRTRAGLASIQELEGISVSRHRSHQVTDADLERADLVVAMEADHVRYVRRIHPEAAPRTATLRRACRDLPAAADAGSGDLRVRVTALGLAEVVLSDDEDVEDPAGKDEAAYIACAREIWDLCVELMVRI